MPLTLVGIERGLAEIRKRRRVFWWTFASALVVFPTAGRLSFDVVFPAAFVGWAVACNATLFYALVARCPRCDNWFHDFWYFWGLWSVLRTRCAHCKLELDADASASSS